jgi:hypothetical protein
VIPIEYVVVRPQIVGNVEYGFRTAYYSDHVRHPNRRAAIRHGLNIEGHDDFVLAHLRGGELLKVTWQYEDRPEDDEADERMEMALALGWRTSVLPPAMHPPAETDGGQS